MLPAWHSQPEQKALVGISHLWNQSQFQHYRGDKEGEGGGCIPLTPHLQDRGHIPSCNHLLNFSADVPLLRQAPSRLWLLCPPLETSGRRWRWRVEMYTFMHVVWETAHHKVPPQPFLNCSIPTTLGMWKYGERQRARGSQRINVFSARINIHHGHSGKWQARLNHAKLEMRCQLSANSSGLLSSPPAPSLAEPTPSGFNEKLANAGTKCPLLCFLWSVWQMGVITDAVQGAK